MKICMTTKYIYHKDLYDNNDHVDRDQLRERFTKVGLLLSSHYPVGPVPSDSQ